MLNAWYACLIDIRNIKGLQTGVQLKDKLPDNFVEFSLTKTTAKYNFETIKSAFPKAQIVSEESLNTKIIAFSTCNQYKTFRGKYEMQFLLDFLKLLFQDSLTTKTFIKQKLKYGFNIQTSGKALFVSHIQAINLFSGYAETQQELLDYLEVVTN